LRNRAKDSSVATKFNYILTPGGCWTWRIMWGRYTVEFLVFVHTQHF